MSELTGGGGLTVPNSSLVDPSGGVTLASPAHVLDMAGQAIRSAGPSTDLSVQDGQPILSANPNLSLLPKIATPSYRQTSTDSVGNVKPVNSSQTKLGKLLTVLRGGLQGAEDSIQGGALNAPRQGQSPFGTGFGASLQMPLLRRQQAQEQEQQALQTDALRNQVSLLPFQRAQAITGLQQSQANVAKTNAEVKGLPIKQQLEQAQAEAARFKEVDGVLYDMSGGTPKAVPNAGNFVPADQSTAPILGVAVGTKVPLTTAAKASQIASTREGKELQKSAQQIQIRGQNMTDARSRDANEIKRQDKIDLNNAASENQLAGFNSGMDRLAVAANELMNHPGLGGITGVRGKIPSIPGTDAANAAAKLDTLKSQAAFSVLQDLRNQSKTGGALGQVSDKEEQMLSSNLAALNTSQSTAEFKKSLKKIIDFTEGAKQRARGALGRTQSATGKGGSNVIVVSPEDMK